MGESGMPSVVQIKEEDKDNFEGERLSQVQTKEHFKECIVHNEKDSQLLTNYEVGHNCDKHEQTPETNYSNRRKKISSPNDFQKRRNSPPNLSSRRKKGREKSKSWTRS